MKVYVGISGGIDSSVAAYLLKKEGFDVVGVFFKLEKESNLSRCCDITSAHFVAHKLQIPFVEIDVSNEFESFVKDYFWESLKLGFTPNPCVICNEKIKFGIGFEYAKKHFGDGLFATGHYAIIEDKHLKKGIDPVKDQSYMLWRLKKGDLKRYIFPLGRFLKTQVKEIAFSLGLKSPKESEDLCFIKGDIREFIKEHLKEKTGKIIDKFGTILGYHKGYYFYTVGQRSGLGIAYKEPLYVVNTDPINNLVIVSTKKDCYFSKAKLTDVNILEEVSLDEIYEAKVRYQTKPAKCRITKANDEYTIEFLEKQFAITKGQSCVIYRGDTVVMGGIIKEAIW